MEFSERVPPYGAAGVSASAQVNLTLGFTAFTYADLYEPDRLGDLLAVFDGYVADRNPLLFIEFGRYRATLGEGLPPQTISDLLVRMAPYVAEFVAKLLGGRERARPPACCHTRRTRHGFCLPQRSPGASPRKFRPEDLMTWDLRQLQRQIEILKHVIASGVHASDPERALAGVASELWRLRERCTARTSRQAPVDKRLEQDLCAVRARIEADLEARAAFADCLTEAHAQEFVLALYDRIERWSFAACHDAGINATVANWVSFKEARKTDFQHLVHAEQLQRDGYQVLSGPMARRRRRDGFALTDPRHDERHVLYEIDHCIYCHDRDTDSCSKGMRNRRDGSYKVNPLGVMITGCPLEEKISEMHVLKRQGDNIGALALIMIDNPMCPGTGHRICNDCMKGCIYQKTEPVNIPQIETNVLTEVLFMPWGFEIYGLFTRWNPLNVKRPVALPYNGKNVLIAGLGPAGYTLAHYLLNEGFGVVGIDGLKIEPLPRDSQRRLGSTAAAGAGFWRALRDLGYPHHDGFRRSRGIRHHRALGQEFSQGHLSHARPAADIPLLRRHPFRRHVDDQRGLGSRISPHRRRERRRQTHDHRAWE